jgi:hypothetical protein
MCRAPLARPADVAPLAARMIVDLSKCERGESPSDETITEQHDGTITEQHDRTTTGQHDLDRAMTEQRLVTEVLEGRRLGVQHAANLADEVSEFLREKPPNEVISRRVSFFATLSHNVLFYATVCSAKNHHVPSYPAFHLLGSRNSI